MELPIIPKFEQTFYDCPKAAQEQLVRILDIDGTYLVTIITSNSFPKTFVENDEIAFTSLMEAVDFLYTIGIEVEENKDSKEWKDYEPY